MKHRVRERGFNIKLIDIDIHGGRVVVVVDANVYIYLYLYLYMNGKFVLVVCSYRLSKIRPDGIRNRRACIVVGYNSVGGDTIRPAVFIIE